MNAGRRGPGGFGGGPGGWGDWDGWDGGSRRGSGRRGRMFASGELRLVLLKLIADEPRHGYQLIKAVEEMTGGQYAPSPGVVYPTLSLLADEGAIVESDSSEEDGRKPFAATEQGKAELAEREEEVEALMARLTRVGEGERKNNAPELFRAMGNLGTVLKHRIRKEGGFDQRTIEEIVDIIDEAAKRIERL